MYTYKNHTYTHGPTVINTLNNPLQFCIDIANAEVHDNIAFKISFVEYVYELYVAAVQYQRMLDYVQSHPHNHEWIESVEKRKKLTYEQFVSLLDPYVQEMIDLKSPIGWLG